MERTSVLQRVSLLVSCLAAIVFGLASASSVATTVNGERSIKVSYGELDLTKPTGAEALYRRIRRAAFTVCGAYDSPMPGSYAAKSRCFKSAVDDAVSKVNSPLLTSLHRNENTRLASK